YFEVSKSMLDKLPHSFIRRQSLANAERFTTPELQDLEERLLSASQRRKEVEYSLFMALRAEVEKVGARIMFMAEALASLDYWQGLAEAASAWNWSKPTLNKGGGLKIIAGRHPVVEAIMGQAHFIPNNLHLDDDCRVMLITGPNMSGKSTILRQAAMICILAQMGSFVPATQAELGLVDRVFSRVGASDNLAKGLSTFMVEMTETARILRQTGQRSLIILDEIGRGTSTFDGLAIAWAVIEDLAKKSASGLKVLFATHYHELSELEERFGGVKNYCLSVVEHGEDIIFLRKVLPGGADKSYGVHVARLAGIPGTVVARAREIQARLEVSDINQESISHNILEKKKKREKQTDLFHMGQDALVEELKNLDVMAITPMDAMNALFRLREKARRL
ncbi:MAG: DNA mismatch repair protein MutS, partial [Clostridia bacterium]|nr:DNA mismatch repair protein MutS [Clostridia bacterium]